MCNVRILLHVICLSFVVTGIVDGFSFTLGNITRLRRQANAQNQNCLKPKFACNSGECIDGDSECDGTVDCQDASDESNACRRIKCPDFLFTCNYGACINKKLECDGKPDCRDGSDERTPKCTKIDDTSPKCSGDQFRCSSGQCIDGDLKCDGTAECDDHSDEIKATCWNIRCPGFTHKCSYGGCVNGDAQCNGLVECFDGSDEDPALCKNNTVPALTTTEKTVTPARPPTGAGSCALPNYPELGTWLVHGTSSPGALKPGMFVSSGTTLVIKCNHRQFKLEGDTAILCNNGQWTSPVGKCLKTCQSIHSTPTMTVTCTYNNRVVENCTEAVDGTLAKFKCAPFYEDLNLKRHPVHICTDGSWDQPTPKCTPVCGQKVVEPTTLIINGTAVKKGNYPWQVAIYTNSDKTLICGGSLLNQKIILTAAHCVTDEKASTLPAENYIVAVGKYYRKYNDSRDHNEAQFSTLKKIIVSELYQGDVQNYLGDIAILITQKTFTLSIRVQPVCLDTGHVYSLERNEFGFVTGWGYTAENSEPSDYLKELKVPSVSFTQCRNNIPEDFEVFLTFDKMCAGYLGNKTSVCKGDSGGGLVFEHEGRYYVTGVVSLAPTAPTGGCDSQQYGLYTKVSNYIENFILPKTSGKL